MQLFVQIFVFNAVFIALFIIVHEIGHYTMGRLAGLHAGQMRIQLLTFPLQVVIKLVPTLCVWNAFPDAPRPAKNTPSHGMVKIITTRLSSAGCMSINCTLGLMSKRGSWF